MQPFEKKTIEALRFIVEIFNRHNVPYRIGGGFAAHVYGSSRPIKDIDITFPGKYFPIIMSDVSEYIEHELKHYSNEKWDCDGLTLNYYGQEIDITDINTLQMSNLKMTEWYQTKNNFRKFDPILTDVNGIKISLIDPRDLVAYKKELADEGHLYQLVDIKAIQEYIDKN